MPFICVNSVFSYDKIPLNPTSKCIRCILISIHTDIPKKKKLIQKFKILQHFAAYRNDRLCLKPLYLWGAGLSRMSGTAGTSKWTLSQPGVRVVASKSWSTAHSAWASSSRLTEVTSLLPTTSSTARTVSQGNTHPASIRLFLAPPAREAEFGFENCTRRSCFSCML